MPRNGSGVYSKVANTAAVSGEPVSSADYNATIDDIVTDLNTARPIVAGGTGAETVSDARDNLNVPSRHGRVVKSANYTAIEGDDGAWFDFDAAATLSLTAAATLGNQWECLVKAGGGDVTIDPTGSEKIDGLTTLKIAAGSTAIIHCSGVGFYTALSSADAGDIKATARSTAPGGWLACDGATVSRTTYAALFAAIGTTFGTGDGSTTFTLPDMEDEFVRGASSTRNVGDKEGEALKSHAHNGTTDNRSISIDTNRGDAAGTVRVARSDGTSGGVIPVNIDSHNHNFTTNAAGGSETRPRNIALLWCIKF